MYVQWQRRAEQYYNLMILCSCVVELTLRDPRGSFRGQKDNNVGESHRGAGDPSVERVHRRQQATRCTPRGHGAGACTLWGSHYARSRQQLLSSSPLHILETPLDSLSFTSEKRDPSFCCSSSPNGNSWRSRGVCAVLISPKVDKPRRKTANKQL